MSLIRAALLHLNSEGASGGLPFQWQLSEVYVLLFRPCRQLDFLCFASATRWICMQAGGHYSLLANARQIYGAMAIKSVHHHCSEDNNDSWGGRSQWKRALMRNNKSCLPALIQNGSRIQRGLQLRKRYSNASNYGTASYKSISISISISIISGFTTSRSQVCNVCKQRKDDSLKFKLSPICILHLAILPNCQKGRIAIGQLTIYCSAVGSQMVTSCFWHR